MYRFMVYIFLFIRKPIYKKDAETARWLTNPAIRIAEKAVWWSVFLTICITYRIRIQQKLSPPVIPFSVFVGWKLITITLFYLTTNVFPKELLDFAKRKILLKGYFPLVEKSRANRKAILLFLLFTEVYCAITRSATFFEVEQVGFNPTFFRGTFFDKWKIALRLISTRRKMSQRATF